ncbi:MAG: hypothetical protein R3195_12625 [Gemmatimonadota bacterium]|nr:hypothetical protein [Gemmatimonadota bacterium]
MAGIPLGVARRGAAGGVFLVLGSLSPAAVAGQSAPDDGPRLTRIADVAVPLSVSPDSRLIAEMGSSGNLAIRSVETGQVQNVTDTDFPELVMNAAFSPGSDLIAFAWHNDEDHDDLRIVGVDGSGLRVLYRDPAARSIRVNGWSPDGAQILVTIRYRDSAAAVALVPAAGGTPATIGSFESRGEASPGRMVFSPDGRSIAYDRPGDAGEAAHDVYVMALNDRRHVSLTRSSADDRVLGWSPAGDGVVFASNRSGAVDVWLQPASIDGPEGAPTRLMTDLGALRPLGLDNGGTYFFSRERCDCSLLVDEMDSNGRARTDARRVLAPALHNAGAYWSPDGERLVSVEPGGGVIPPGLGQPWALVIRAPDGQVENTWTPPVDILHQLRPLWSPDGRRVLVKGWDRYAYPREIVLGVDAATGQYSTLLSSSSVWERQLDWVTWSADGGSLYYTDLTASGSVGLYRWDLESRSEETLIVATPPPFYYGLAPSPDGRSLAFALWDTQGEASTLVVMDLETREQEELARVAFPASISPPTWSPSSRQLFYGVGGRLWRVDLTGGESEQVLVGESVHYNQAGLGLHPDGKRLVYVRERGRSSEVWALEGAFPPP